MSRLEQEIKKVWDRSAEDYNERGTGAFDNSYDSINKDLFMSSRYRPLWDLGYLMEIGFSSVFAVPDIRSFIPEPEHMEEVDRELSDLTAMFLVGAEK